MTRNITFLILYFTLNCCYAQDLNKLYKEAVESSDLKLATQVNVLAVKQQNEKVVADSYYLIAYLQKGDEDFFNAVINYMEAARHYRELGDFSSFAKIIKNLGYIYRQSGFKNTGLKYSYDALHLNIELRDTVEQMHVLYNIGQAYWDMGKPDSALTYYEKALDISEALENNYTGRIYNDIGINYYEKKNYKTALEYYDQADQFDNSVAMKARTLNNRGYLYLHTGDTLKAYNNFRQVLGMDLSQVESRTLSFVYANIGQIQTKPDSAIHFYERSFSYLKDNPLAMAAEYYSTCKELEKYYRLLGNDSRAAYFDDLQDKFNEEMIVLREKLRELNLRYQVEAATWKQEMEEKAEELSKVNQILKYVILALLLALVALLFFYRRIYEARKKEGNILIEARELKEKLSS